MSRWVLALALFVGCAKGSGDSGGAASDVSDADADTDADADADSDADSDTDSDTDADTDTVSFDIAAASGGVVDGFGASLDIPAGSLAADTTITLSSSSNVTGLPDAGTIDSSTWDFGPNGTTFSTQATLTLPVSGTPSGTDTVPVISWLDGSTWMDLATTESGSTVSAPVEHFTTFGVRWVDGAELTCEATACGGDPVGAWTRVSSCWVGGGAASDPFGGVCSDNTFAAGFVETGTTTISAGTYDQSLSLQAVFWLTASHDCLALLGYASCADFAASDPDMTCDVEGWGCDCTATEGAPIPFASQGTWSMNGSQMTFIDSIAGPVTYDYCVDGTSMTLDDSNLGLITTMVQ